MTNLTSEKTSMFKDSIIILASSSPRRKMLLKEAGLNFIVIDSKFDEAKIALSTPREYTKTLAYEKAKTVALKHPDAWVIGADTIVFINDKILGKPKSKNKAYEMLLELSDSFHYVYTGYSIFCMAKNKIFTNCEKTKVYFKKLSKKEIDFYITTKEPFDKAGGYAAQGIGSFLIKRIEGSYTNVVGLPVCEVLDILIKEKAIIL
jgi:septum formation protein